MSRIRQSISSQNEIICVISHENISKAQKRTLITSLADDKNKDIVGSCLFLKTETLDYNFIPNFPNYLYAFTSSLVPALISRKRSNGVIRLTVCVLCTLLALFHMLLELRQSFDACMENKELYSYVSLLNSALPVFTCGQVLNILLQRRKLLLRTFWNPKPGEFSRNSCDQNMRKAIRATKAFNYGFLAFGLFCMGTVDFVDITEWTITGLLQINANYLVELIKAEPSTTGVNATISSPLLNASGETIQLETVLLGSFGYAMQLASFLTLGYVKGLFLFAGITMKEVAEKFHSLLNIHSPNGSQIKHVYEFMFRSTSRMNLSIGGLLATHHIQMLLDFVLVLRIMLADGAAKDYSSVALWVLPDAVITAAAYYYATRTPIKMDAFRSWIRSRENQESLRLDANTVQNLLDELNTNPSGVGKGIFYVNADLIAKLLSSIGTVFLVIATRTD